MAVCVCFLVVRSGYVAYAVSFCLSGFRTDPSVLVSWSALSFFFFPACWQRRGTYPMSSWVSFVCLSVLTFKPGTKENGWCLGAGTKWIEGPGKARGMKHVTLLIMRLGVLHFKRLLLFIFILSSLFLEGSLKISSARHGTYSSLLASWPNKYLSFSISACLFGFNLCCLSLPGTSIHALRRPI